MEKLQQQLAKAEDYDFYKADELFCKLDLETFDDLQRSELMAFLPTILSEERFVLFERLLKLLQTIPYSQSYARRSYRAPQSVKLHSTRLMKFILWLKNHPAYDFYAVFEHNAKEGYASGVWQFVTKDKEPIMLRELFTYELALRLNAREARAEQYVRDILWKNGAHPLYTRELIRGILMSEHEEMHQLLANVLIAAKNQEGVRQVIAESIDEGSLKAQLTFMNVILEHDLLRFSSIVRAVDVWFGLGYDVSNRRQLQYVLETSYAALQDETIIEQLLESDSNLDIFIALWCIACRDINGVFDRTDALLTRADYVQQTMLYTLYNMEMTRPVYDVVSARMLQTDNLTTFMFGIRCVIRSFPYTYCYKDDDERKLVDNFFTEHPWLANDASTWLQKVQQMRAAFRGETYEVNSTPFTFLHATFERVSLFKLELLLALHVNDERHVRALATAVTKMSVNCRDYFYFFAPACLGDYDLLMPALKDRSATIRLDVVKKLQTLPIPFEQLKSYIPSLLALKSGEMRVAVIEMLKKRPLDEMESFAIELLQSKKEPVRLRTLELLVELKDQLAPRDWSSYIECPSEKEKGYLQLFEQQKTSFLDEPLEPLHYIMEPETDVYFTFKDFAEYDFKLLAEKLMALRALIEEHAEVAYTQRGYEQTVLIGERLTLAESTPEAPGSIDQLPLAEVWCDWLMTCELSVDDVYCYLYLKEISRNFYWGRRNLSQKCLALLNTYLPEERQDLLENLFDEAPYEQQVSTIMHYLVGDGDAPLQTTLHEHLESVAFDYVAFCSGMLRDLVVSCADVDLGMKDKDTPYTLLDISFFSAAFSEMGFYAHTMKPVTQYFYTASLYFERVEDYFNHIPLASILLAVANDMLTIDHLRRIVCMKKFAYMLELRAETVDLIDWYSCSEEVYEMIHALQTYVIEEELARGELEAKTTYLVSHIRKVPGIDYFIRLLKALGEEKLSRQWTYGVHTRKDSLSTLLERVELSEEDMGEESFAKLDAAGFTAERLIEAMFYNTTLIPFISRYIDWEGLEDVAWYFIAHTSEYNSDFEKAKIMEYSAIPATDFQRGAFDRAWFMTARTRLTAEQFDIVYNAAKYASSGSNHRRAQLYARATLGELDAEALRAEICDKRNKDKLRAYSLLPATMDEAKERYLFFQQFLKESRAFGAQRRASEAEAVEMAIFNLAQQAANGNTTQFMWQMEQERYRELEKWFTPQEIDDVQLYLVYEEQKVDVRIMKNGKALKSVPKKIAKQPDVLELLAAKKELTEQARRMRQQLERAMCEETVFDAQIVHSLLENPLFETLLRELIWCQNDKFYAIRDKQFVALDGSVVQVAGELQIAHPAHFYAAGNWRSWQRFVFEHGYKQPFKQVFRELYVPTEEEREVRFTNRFEGYQIQPTKAVALLKSRGWKASYDEAVRKISYRYNAITYIDFVYDYGTPGDVEAPTLRDICFYGRLTNKKMKLGDVAPVHFSEVMRDIDLVVSVAHAGEVDPEASHSTIEMRAVIAEEIIELFQLTNAEVKAPHIVLHGSLGNYTIHLGSGNVHQLGGAMIPVMAIPSQHRGRVFLPFVDEDPKTAEINAKLLLFADDGDINDPGIRGSIRS
ncbi:DUF5724 domain-containing protein [Lysinibacillus sp. LZ02]|uniref:DUF4132 domain-containing protein n=1 Tax=Lysinibacillus sp. LZ02 TaxID=3420668 RepID=UPI003D35B31F